MSINWLEVIDAGFFKEHLSSIIVSGLPHTLFQKEASIFKDAFAGVGWNDLDFTPFIFFDLSQICRVIIVNFWFWVGISVKK